MKTGDLIDEKFQIDQLIGQGSFGKVFLARDLGLDRKVAIKLLPMENIRPESLAMFQREAVSLAELKHPNIVTVYSNGECPDGPYMVLEYVDGMSLEKLVSVEELSLSRVLHYSIQICEGMDYTHNSELIHRDLTLNNIMLKKDNSEFGTVLILDFGLVKMLDAHSQSRGLTSMGTPLYMSPEQISGGKIDKAVDIFAFGVCLYRLLHGRFPFESEHPAAIAYLILHESPFECDKNLPAGLAQLIEDCLQKESSNRPGSFKTIVETLRRVQADTTDHGSKLAPALPGDTIPYLRSSRRNPYLNRVMIKNPLEFIGRTREIRKIYSRIDASHPQSVSVVGERRIGKSSLLNFIYHKENRKKFMTTNDQAIFVYLDFQRIADFSVPKFIQFIFGVIEIETGRNVTEGRDLSLDSLLEVVSAIHDDNMRIIFLMDEFEVITRNVQFDVEFFSFLRSLANGYRVSYVTSSCDELQHLCHHQDISDSPFFNIFSNLPLRPFPTNEAEDLISLPSSDEGLSLADYSKEIIQITGRFPFFLQICCSVIYEELLDKPDTSLDWERITDAFRDEANPHYEFIWDHFSSEEKTNLARVVSGKPISRKFEFLNEILIRRGYLENPAGTLRFTSSEFRNFVAQAANVSPKRQPLLTSLWDKFRSGRET